MNLYWTFEIHVLVKSRVIWNDETKAASTDCEECRKCQHEQKTAERQLKTTETRVLLSILSFSFFVLGHSSLHLRDASLRVCIVKTAVSDQENWIEVAVRHHQKTGWRDKELYSKWREVQSKEWREWDHEVSFCGTPKKPWLVLNSGAPEVWWKDMAFGSIKGRRQTEKGQDKTHHHRPDHTGYR